MMKTWFKIVLIMYGCGGSVKGGISWTKQDDHSKICQENIVVIHAN